MGMRVEPPTPPCLRIACGVWGKCRVLGGPRTYLLAHSCS